MDVRTQKKIIQQFYKARIENHQNEYIHPPYQLEQKLLTAIRMRNEKEAISALRQINEMKRAKLAKRPVTFIKKTRLSFRVPFLPGR